MAGKITCPQHGRKYARLVSADLWRALGRGVNLRPRTLSTGATAYALGDEEGFFPVCRDCLASKAAGEPGPYPLADIMADKAANR